MIQQKGVKKEKRVHPTQKPVRVMEWILENYSKEGDTICDPFMGSGTTGVACKKLNRNFIGIEKDPDYFKIAQYRISQPVERPLF
jgi:site-specific DNA-methyltransferase (adenine-specific)